MRECNIIYLFFNLKPSTRARNYDDFRYPVQYVNRPNLNFRGFCGTVASGVVRKGDEIMVLPSRKKSRIKSIVTFDEELELAWQREALLPPVRWLSPLRWLPPLRDAP